MSAEWWEDYVPEEGFNEFCPVGHAGDPAAHMHCTCWYDGDGCCRCNDPAMTEEQKVEQGMEP